jgi:hypothetical protein
VCAGFPFVGGKTLTIKVVEHMLPAIVQRKDTTRSALGILDVGF